MLKFLVCLFISLALLGGSGLAAPDSYRLDFSEEYELLNIKRAPEFRQIKNGDKCSKFFWWITVTGGERKLCCLIDTTGGKGDTVAAMFALPKDKYLVFTDDSKKNPTAQIGSLRNEKGEEVARFLIIRISMEDYENAACLQKTSK